MGVEIVQNHMQLFAGIFGNQLIHEIQELTSAPATIMSGMHQPRSYLQSGEERRGTVALVLVSKTGQCGERQKVGGPVLATMGRTPRSTTRRINRLKSTVADLLQPPIFRPPTFWRSPISSVNGHCD